MPSPALRYSLQLSQGTTSNLTYVNVNQTATLKYVVSNPGQPVTVTSITFGFPPFGQTGTALAGAPADVTPILPAGWMAVPGSAFAVRPTTGSAVIGTGSLIFEFSVNMNSAPGAAQIAITEVTTGGTAFPQPNVVTKMPADFTLAGLVATPAEIAPGATVTLTWTGTANQSYAIQYPGGNATVTAPSGGQAAWTSPAIQSAYPTVGFTVSASRQVSGQALFVQASASVIVDVPQIISFPQPGAFNTAPVTLTWQTVNADHCVLMANGSPVDSNAPANTPASGYLVYPAGHTTQYQLYAYKGTAYVASQPVTVTLYNWAFLRSYSFGDVSSTMALTITGDGSVLYYGGNTGIWAIDTNAFSVLQQGSVPGGVAQGGLALSRDGRKLFVSVFRGNVLVFDTSNLGAAPATIQVRGGPLVLSQDGTTLYVASGMYAGGPTSIVALDTSTYATANQTTIQDLGATGMRLSSDGKTLYLVGMAALYAVDTATLTPRQVATSASTPLALAPDGSAVYTGAPWSWGGGISTTIQKLAIPGFTTAMTCTPIAMPSTPGTDYGTITGIVTDPSGGLYVSVMLMGLALPDGSKPGTAYYFVNPVSGKATLLTTAPYRPNFAGLLVDPGGDRLYIADCINIQVFSSSGGGPVTFDAVHGTVPSLQIPAQDLERVP